MKCDEFDPVSCPMEGCFLVEAGAGTGKTYAITRIYLRMIAEKGFLVNEVLVVTFTVAATQELKHRLRRTLQEALEYFSTGQFDDENLKAVLDSMESVSDAEERLRIAVRDFDEAAVYTIHGFCSRVLKDFAFETGTQFDVETVADQEDLKTEIARDFRRKHIYSKSPMFLDYLEGKGGFDGVMASLSAYIGRKNIRIEPAAPPQTDTSNLEKNYQSVYEEAKALWDERRDEVETVLTTDKALNRQSYNVKYIPGRIAKMDEWISGGKNRCRSVSETLTYFRQSCISKKVKKNCDGPHHPFFEACEKLHHALEELREGFEQRFVELRLNLFAYLRRELQIRRLNTNTQSYDDLLTGVHDAISGEKKAPLIEKIGKKYRAALIDEFQDTDSIQYEIFKTLFHQGPLFFIGDPKQAIYGFRGADIFSYLEAASHVDRKYTLTRNWRSVPELIEAVNVFFANTGKPFVFDAIRFEKGSPADRDYSERLVVDDEKDHSGLPSEKRSFVFWRLGDFVNDKETLNKDIIREKAYHASAAEISRLVGLGRLGKARIGNAPLREKDIAVLVMRNAEAEDMRDVLAGLNIPSVAHGVQNVLITQEADEITRFLDAAAHPGNERKIRSAIVADMIGFSGDELYRLSEDETRFEEWLLRFKDYHDQWRRDGFMKMFAAFLFENGVRERLMSLDQGERRLTNVIHVAEIIHERCSRERLSPRELLRWFLHLRKTPDNRSDDYLLRLSTDENAVHIVTVHKSKGLEYPVVFLPFSWDVMGNNIDTPFLYHDDGKAILDMGSPDCKTNQEIAKNEALSERIRQFYVALTRAKHRCYLVFPKFKGRENSAPWRLAGETVEPSTDAETETDSPDGENAKNNECEIEPFLRKASGKICIEDLPETSPESLPKAQAEPETPACREFNGKIRQSFKISSFSTLVLDHKTSPDETDRDDVPDTTFPEEIVPERNIRPKNSYHISNFPRGKIPGTFIHKLFESIDFTKVREDSLETVVKSLLEEYNQDEKWLATLTGMIRNVMTVPMDPDDESFILSRIPDSERITEMGFYFPLKRINRGNLSDLFKNSDIGAMPQEFPRKIETLEFGETGGFMRGFIDLIFRYKNRYYILDWKSNHLGADVSDYGREAMERAMVEHMYILQYLVYTLALDQYLKHRIPGYDYDTHFGGVLYLFIRGIDPKEGPRYGVYRDRPAKELIESLSLGMLNGGNNA